MGSSREDLACLIDFENANRVATKGPALPTITVSEGNPDP
jgi:hypothetical protein